MTIGTCSKCGRFDMNVFTIDNVQVCDRCGGATNALAAAGALVDQVRARAREDGVDVPSSFFDMETGRLRLPPWQYGRTTIDMIKSERNKTLTIVIPVGGLRDLTNREIIDLIGFTERLRQAFERIVPAGWTVSA